MKVHFRRSLVGLFIVCSLIIGVVSFLPTYLIGISGAEKTAMELQRTLEIYTHSQLIQFSQNVQEINTLWRTKWLNGLWGRNSGHERLKADFCTTLVESSIIVYTNFALQSDGFWMGCQKFLYPNSTIEKVHLYARNSSTLVNGTQTEWSMVMDWRTMQEQPSYLKDPDYDPRTRGWYKTILQRQSWTSPYLYIQGTQSGSRAQGASIGITAGLPLIDPITNVTMGVFGVDVTVNALGVLLQKIPFTSSNTAILIIAVATEEVIGLSWDEPVYMDDGQGGTKLKKVENLLRPQVIDAVGHLGATSKAIVALPAGSSRVKHWWFVNQDITDNYGLHWRAVVILDENDFLGDFKKLRFLLMIIVAGFILLITFLQVIAGNSVARSLHDLNTQMDELQMDIVDMTGQEEETVTLESLSKLSSHSQQVEGADGQKGYLKLSRRKRSYVSEVSAVEDSFQSMSVTIKSFARFVPREVVCDLLTKGKMAEVEMRAAYCSIMFCDIESFTLMTERCDTDEMARAMEIYFDSMTKIVHEHGGSVDKYIGDCIMVLWGVPMAVDNLNVRSVSCALSMHQIVQSDVMQLTFSKTGMALNCRFGIHTGHVHAGNMGGHNRLNYTVIGSTVNMAARLERLNKQFGTRIMISETIAADIKDIFLTRLLHCVVVYGFDTEENIYEVRGLLPEYNNVLHLNPTTLEKSNKTFDKPMDLELLSVTASTKTRSGYGKGKKMRKLREDAMEIGNLLRKLQASRLQSVSRVEEEYCAAFSLAVERYLHGDFHGCLAALDTAGSIFPQFQESLSHQHFTKTSQKYVSEGKPENWVGRLVLESK